MIFLNKIIPKIFVAWVTFFFTWATFFVHVSEAASVAEIRLVAELKVIKGDLRRLNEISSRPLIKRGLKKRLLGASAPLSLLIRRAREHNSTIPFPPENSLIGLQQALIRENFEEAKFWVDELLRVFPFETKNILPTDIIKELADKTRAMHEEFCSSCHNSNATSLDEIDIERPAWNLFQLAQEVGKEELAARLIIGVKGDSLTAMDNPLSIIEISRFIEFYSNRHAD